MIEKPQRPKKITNQDNKLPQTIQELIRRYDLDNTKVYDFLDDLVGHLKQTQTVVSATEPTGEDREKVWMQKGKNILNIGTITEYTKEGVKTSVNTSKIYLSGTKSTSNHIFQNTGIDKGNQYLYLGKLKSGTYTLSRQIIGTISGNIAFNIWKDSGTSISNLGAITELESDKSVTFTLIEETKLYFSGWINSGTVLDCTFCLQLEQGSETTEYEEYIKPKIYVINHNDVYEEFI